jgi:Membrane bound beta barrel domain (DUF5777)
MRSLLLLGLAFATAQPALGGEPTTVQEPADSTNWDDYEIDPLDPDFTVINLPTTLRLPKHKLAFRVTHRFSRPLGRGDFSDLLGDLFGLDSGAQIGLGLRFGLASGTQLEVYRISDKTLQFQAHQSVLRQSEGPLGLSVTAGVEGADNFGEDHSPNVGVVASRVLGDRATVFVAPYWVGNVDLAGDGESSFIVGLGSRLRLSRTLYATAEWHPRIAGFDGGGNNDHILAFGLEARVGGHSFQFNFSNDLATTPAQIARGQVGPDDFFIGFNITRKFY